MGLMDAINPEATTTIKIGDLYKILEAAAVQKTRANYLLNGVINEVPYKYIREVITGEKENEEADPVVVSAAIDIHASELARIVKREVIENTFGRKEDKAAGEDDDNHFTAEELERMSDDDLKNLAETLGVINIAGKSRDELIDAIKSISLDSIDEDEESEGADDEENTIHA